MTLIYLAAFLFGIGEMLADTTMQTLVPAVVDNDQLERANGQLYASQSVGNEFVGPPVGSVLFSAVAAAPFLANALAWGTSALVLSRLKVAQPSREGRDPTSLLEDIVEGARWLFAQPILRALAVWAVFVNAALAAFTSIYVLYALDVLGVSEAAYGFLTAAAGVGGVTGTLLAGRAVRRFGRTLVVQGGSVLAGLSALAAGLLASPLPFAALLFVLTASAAAVIIVLTALRQTIVPGRMLGRITATTRVFSYGALPIGALLGGWLAGTFDLRTPFLVGGSVVIVAGLLIGRWLSPQAIEQARAAAQASG
jgi:predicted MFS family arabinose efflux permease